MREPIAKTLTAMLTEGQLIDDKYQLLGEIAQGDLGPVYQAAEVPSGHICVLRFITRVAGPDGSLVGRLRQESEQVEKLRHPNIMPFGEVGEVEGQVYAAREFVEGVTLQDLMEREAPFSLPRACSIARQVASALETAHNGGVLHGNLNPSNVLVNEQDGLAAVKVLGLGSFALKEKSLIDIARVILSGSECPTGSPAYISPEQAVGTEADTLDGRSDLYSLGVLLYHMLAGEPPFGGKNAMQVLLGHVFDDPPPLRNRPGIQVPEVVETLITRSLAKKREQRPSSATAWVDQLRPWEKPALTADTSAEPARMPAPFTFWQGAFAATSSRAGNGDAEPEGVEKPAFTMDFKPANPTLRPGGPSEIQPPSAPALGGLPPTPSPGLSFGANFGPQGPGRPSPPTQTPEAVSAARQADDSETKLVAPMEPESFIIAGLEPEGAGSPRSFGRTSGSSIDLDLQERPVPEPVRGPAPLESGVRSGSGSSDGQQAETGLWWRTWLTAVVVVLLGIGLAIGWLYYSGRRYWLRPEYVLGRAESIVPHGSPSAPSTSPAPGSSSASSLPPSVPPPATTGPAASARSSLQPPAQAGPQPQGDHAQKTLNQIATSKPAVSAPPARRGLAASARSSLQRSAQAASQPRGDHAQKTLNQIATSKTTVSASSRHKPQSQQAAARNADAVRDAVRRGNYFFLLGQYNAAISAYTAGLTVSPGNPELLAEIARAKRAQAAEAKFLGR